MRAWPGAPLTSTWMGAKCIVQSVPGFTSFAWGAASHLRYADCAAWRILSIMPGAAVPARKRREEVTPYYAVCKRRRHCKNLAPEAVLMEFDQEYTGRRYR
jgi:hypothetical protein